MEQCRKTWIMLLSNIWQWYVEQFYIVLVNIPITNHISHAIFLSFSSLSIIFFSGTGPSSWAEFKTLKLYFIQQHYHILEEQLHGAHRVYKFDYAQYMRTVVTDEVVELLEVTPLTWGIFLIFLWLLYGLWVACGFQYDNGMTMVSIVSAWCLFLIVLLLDIESHRGMQRLHAMVPECFGKSPLHCFLRFFHSNNSHKMF
jgi:hypothetical protein